MSSFINKALSVFLPGASGSSASTSGSPASSSSSSVAATISNLAAARPPTAAFHIPPVKTPHRRRAQGALRTPMRTAFDLDVTMIHGQLMCMGMPRNLVRTHSLIRGGCALFALRLLLHTLYFSF